MGSHELDAATIRSVLLEPFGLGRPAEPVTGVEEWAAIEAAAAEHRLLGALHRGSAIADAPPEVQQRVQAEYFTALTRHLRCVDLLRRVNGVFGAAGIRWAVVKGPVLSELVYPSVDLRGYTDLDLLVHPDDFEPAIKALEAAGGEIVERNWSLMTEEGRGELAVRMPDGAFVDVHWHLLIGPELRRHITLPTVELLDRAKAVPLAGLDLPVLDELDAIVHLTVHAVLAGAHRWRWNLDVLWSAQSIADRGTPSTALTQRFAGAGAGTLAAVMQQRATRVLGVPVELGAGPGRGAWPALVGWYDAARRPERWFGQAGSGRLLVASTRPRLPASAAALGRAVLGTFRSLVRNPGHRWRPERFRRTVVFAKPILQDDPSPTGRVDYFAMVRRNSHR